MGSVLNKIGASTEHTPYEEMEKTERNKERKKKKKIRDTGDGKLGTGICTVVGIKRVCYKNMSSGVLRKYLLSFHRLSKNAAYLSS